MNSVFSHKNVTLATKCCVIFNFLQKDILLLMIILFLIMLA